MITRVLSLLLVLLLLSLFPGLLTKAQEPITCESDGLIYLHQQMRHDPNTRQVFGYTLGKINTIQNLEITSVLSYSGTNQVTVFITIIEPSSDPLFPNRIAIHPLSHAPTPKHHQDVINLPYQTGNIALINCEGRIYFKVPGIIPTISNRNTSPITELRSVRQHDFCELTFQTVMDKQIVLDQFFLGEPFIVAFGPIPTNHLWENSYSLYLTLKSEINPIITGDTYQFSNGDGLTLGFGTPKGEFQLHLALCDNQIHYSLIKT